MKRYLSLLLLLVLFGNAVAQQRYVDRPLFGVAYYDEYMPYDRLEEDIKRMKEAGINVVRIAESTWSTVEPQDNVFDFTPVDRVLDAMHEAGIQVIVGTPTYAVPTWLVRKYPSVMAVTPEGQNQYGARQKMDITNEHFRFHAERVIRKIMEHVKDHPAIIGYQVDNETKHYDTAGENVQQAFVEYMKEKFVTHNFDLEWRGYSYGIQPDVDHFEAAEALDIAGVDVYHPTQDHLTGIEISLAGDLARSMKGGQNYFVIETEAQGFPEWVPYPGQLRLQAFSHLASGANMVAYWHWHSIHNNEVAILFSNEALTAFNSFRWIFHTTYNDVLRLYYDALYKMNVGTDFIDPTVTDFSSYKLMVVPALYAASDDVLERLNRFVEDGGHAVYTFNTGFSNEYVKVRSSSQPGIIHRACGVTYSQFTRPEEVSLMGDPFGVGEANSTVHTWMELLTPTTAEVLASYEHPVWGKYAAVTQNTYGKGLATYVGCMTGEALTMKILEDALKKADLWTDTQRLSFPVVVKDGRNESGKTIRYIMNYSDQPVELTYPFEGGTELLSDQALGKNQVIELRPWGVNIVEEK